VPAAAPPSRQPARDRLSSPEQRLPAARTFFLNTADSVIGQESRGEAVSAPPRGLRLDVEDANSNWGSWRFERLAGRAAAARACGTRTAPRPARGCHHGSWHRLRARSRQGRACVPAGSVAQGPGTGGGSFRPGRGRRPGTSWAVIPSSRRGPSRRQPSLPLL